MIFECPKCGGNAVHDGPIMHSKINGYKYAWTSKRFGIITGNFMCWGKCTKCNHFFEVHLSRRCAKRLERDMWMNDVSCGKVKSLN